MDEKIAIVRERINAASSARVAFDYLIAYAEAAGFRVVPYTAGLVPSVELQWADRRRNPFSLQAHPGHINFYLRSPIVKSHPGLFEAARRAFGPVGMNQRDEYRTHVRDIVQADEMLDFLRRHGAWPSERHALRFRAERLAAVTAEHLLSAAQTVANGIDEHHFGESTTYDLLFDGLRLPPKAVFGLAATAALGFPVGPHNFSAGEGTVCFRLLRTHGYPVVAKNDLESGFAIPANDEDRAWTEGRVRLVTHLRRERGTGLAAAKREHFRRQHGRLFCERCRMDPLEIYGLIAGEACIEVHHHDTELRDMTEGHRTRLDDLQCLCANCHRVIHRELKERLTAAS
jgi:hypothetical protein